MVMEDEKIFTKRNLLQIAQNKCISVKRDINLFTNRFEKMVKIGLPSAWSDKGKFLSFEEYRKSLFIARESESKFQGMADKLRGQIIVDLLMDDFHLLWKIKKLFSNPPTYEKYTEIDITYKHMRSFNYPSNETWELFLQCWHDDTTRLLKKFRIATTVI
jgi:hypothetical protein